MGLLLLTEIRQSRNGRRKEKCDGEGRAAKRKDELHVKKMKRRNRKMSVYIV